MNKKLKTLLLLAALLLPWAAQAQWDTLSTNLTYRTGVDATRWKTLTAAAQMPTMTGEWGNADDAASDVLNIGFPFRLGETTYTQFSVSTNGRVKLGPTAVSTNSSRAFNYSSSENDFPVLCGVSGDSRVDQNDTSYIKYELMGTTPNRILVIEFLQHGNYNTSSGTLNYQVQLHEDSNSVVIIYGASSATAFCNYNTGIGFSKYDIFSIEVVTHSSSANFYGEVYESNQSYPGMNRYYEMVVPFTAYPRPVVTNIATTTDSAYLTWTGNANSYILEYSTPPFAPGTGTAIQRTTSDTSIALGNLTPGTIYNYALQAVYADDNSDYRTGTFSTECEASSLPYSYGFELTDSLSQCWDFGRSGDGPNDEYPNPGFNQIVYDGDYALYATVWGMYEGYSNYWAVMPPFDAPMSDILLSFYLHTPYTNSDDDRTPVQVGFMTDAEDFSTFVPVQSFDPRTSNFEHITMNFPNNISYPANARIAFVLADDGNGYNEMYLDNIEVTERAACPYAKDLTAMASAGSAIISWSYETASSDATPYQYIVTVAPTDDLYNTLPYYTAETSLILPDLEAGTEYMVWVTPECSNGAYGDSDSIVFSTNRLPCIQPDLSGSDTLMVGNGTNTFDRMPIIYNYNYGYTQMLYPATELSGTTVINSLSMQRPIGAPDFRTALTDLDIYMGHTANATLINGFVPASNLTWVKANPNNITIDSTTGWVTFGLDTTFAYNGTDNLVIAFNAHYTGYESAAVSFYYTASSNSVCTVGDDNSAIDPTTAVAYSFSSERPNIRLITAGCAAEANCAAPIAVVNSTSHSSAHIVWVPGYQETEWNVDYKLQSATAWTNAASGIDEPEFLLTDLLPAEDYEVRVMGVCEDSLYSYVSFSTECGPITREMLPFSYDFTTQTADISGFKPACWWRDESNSYYPLTTSFTVGDKYPVLQLNAQYNSPSTIILPASEMRLDSVELIIEAFKRMNYDYGTLVIGVMTDPTDMETFTAIDTLQINATGVWETLEADLTHVPNGAGRHIALRCDYTVNGSEDNVYIANLILSARSNCRPVTALFADNITHESADIMIRDNDNAEGSSYLIYISTTNDKAAAFHSDIFTGNGYTFTDLTPLTTYYVWVEVQCSDGSVSRDRAYSFTTTETCAEVVDLTAEHSLANHTAVLSWNTSTVGFPATHFVVNYKSANDTAWTVDTITNNYYQITGILEDVTYNYTVTTLCDTHVSTANSGSFMAPNMCTKVGDGTTTTNYYPIHTYYKYSYSQSIYLAEEMSSMGDTIYGITYTLSNTTFNSQVKTFDVYIANTDTSVFADGSSWIPVDSLTLVATVSQPVSSNSFYIPFTTPFVRNTNRNIVIAIDNNTGAYSNSTYWYRTILTDARTIYYNNDNSDINPAAPTSGSTTTSIPNIQFNATCAAPAICGAPMVIATDADEQSISLSWFAGGNETAWDVDYRLIGDSIWTNFQTGTTTTNGTITGLQNGTTYEIRVSHTCEGALYEAVIIANTACGLITIPFSEDFTNETVGTFARSCWTAGSTTNNDPRVVNLSNNGKMVAVDNGAYLTLPTFDMALNQLQASFTYMATEQGGAIQVGVITNPANIETFMPLATVTASNANMASTATVYLNSFSGSAGNLCFYMPAGSYNGNFYVDNIEVTELVSCPVVDSIWVSVANEIDATLTWSTDGPGTVSNYIVEYGPADFVQGTGIVITSATTSVIISNLASSTLYDVYITAVCDGDDTTATMAHRFATACGVATLPYSMNFDMSYLPDVAQTQMMPTCWNYDMVDLTNPYGYYIYPQIGSNFWNAPAQSGPNVLFVRNSAVIALPDFGVPLDTLTLSFYGGTNYQGDIIVVGTVDSITPGFAESFVPIDTIVCQGGANGGASHTMVLCTYGAISGNYLAFHNPGNDVPMYLDDVTVSITEGCLPVSNLVCDSTTLTSAHLSWTTPCGTPQSYEVEYGSIGFTQGSGTTLTTTSNTIAITGLTAASRYDAYVRPICDANVSGDWTYLQFNTAICDELAETYFFRDTVTPATTDKLPGYSYYKYSYSQIIIDSAMMVANGFTAGSVVAGFGFHPTTMDGNAYFSNSRVLMKNSNKSAFTTSNETDFVPMTTDDVKFTGDLRWENIGWNYIAFDVPFTWDGHSNVILAIDRDHGAYAPSSAYFLASTDTVVRAIYQYTDGASNNADPFNMSSAGGSFDTTSTVPQIILYACAQSRCAAIVENVTTTYSSATVTWTGEAVNYEVNVKALADANWPATDIAVNNATSYTFSGLMPATQYKFRVRGLCDEELTGDWTEGTFTTDSLFCFTPSNLAATPNFGTAEMTWTAGGDETAWNIRVWNTAFDQTFPVTANPATVTGLTAGTTYNAAIQAVCGGGLATSEYSDTITFTTDVCDSVSGVSVSNITTNSVVVSWTAGENNTGSFAVEYGVTGFAAGTGTTVNATSTTVTLTDLEEETDYDVYVRAICDGHNSTWSSKTTFTTRVGSINAADGSNMVSIYPNPAEQSTTISISGVEGNVTVTIVDMNGRTVSSTTLECNGDCEKMMNVENLAAGSYFVRLQGNGFNAVKKLVIK